MQINRLEITNFKGTSRYELVPARVNFLIGPNGAGKTTILDAIKCGINGKTPADHVMLGKSGAALQMDIEGVGIIERSWAEGKTVTKFNRRNSTQKAIVEDIQQQLGFSSLTTDIMSSSDAVENIFGKEFSEYLLGFLDNNMTFEHLIELCAPSEDAAKELSMILPAPPYAITLKDIDDAYRHYDSSLKIKKAELPRYQAKAEFHDTIPIKTLEEIDAQNQSASHRKGKLESEIENYNKLSKLYNQNQTLIDGLIAKVSAITVKAPTDSEKDAIDGLIDSETDAIGYCDSEILRWTTEKARLQKILHNLAEPLCLISEKLICTTDKTPITKELETVIKDIEGAIDNSIKRKAEIARSLEKNKQTQRQLVQAVSDCKLRDSYIAQIDGLKKNKIEKPKEIDSSEKYKLDELMETLRVERILRIKYDEAVLSEKLVAECKSKIEVYEELVMLLSVKGGARKKILEYNVAPLQLYCNDKMRSVLPEYILNFDTSNGLKVVLSDSSGNTLSYKALSSGEQIRVLYIVTDMLNALNGFKILIIDNLDGLDETSLNSLISTVIENAEDYDHIFLSSVNGAEAISATKKLPASANVINLPF